MTRDEELLLLERYVAGTADDDDRATMARLTGERPELARELFEAALMEIDCRRAFLPEDAEGHTARMKSRVHARRSPHRPRRRSRRRRSVIPLGAGIALVAVLAVVLGVVLLGRGTDDEVAHPESQTGTRAPALAEADDRVIDATAGRRLEVLGDGSELAVLKGGAVRIAAGGLSLERGTARLRVADQAGEEPFTITGGALTVRVLGTAFTLRRRSGVSLLTMHEGRAAVSAGGRQGVAEAGSLWLSDGTRSIDCRPLVAMDFRGGADPAFRDPAVAALRTSGAVSHREDGWHFAGGRAWSHALGHRIVAACVASEACTFAVAISPAVSDQVGPARIAGVTNDGWHGEVLLLHGGNKPRSKPGEHPDRFQVRLHHDRSEFTNGMASNLWTDPGTTTTLSHVLVCTRDPSGRTRFYLDGVLASERLMPGSLAVWNEDHPLVLGNEYSEQRPWRGRIASLVVLDRDLAPDEVRLLSAAIAD